MQLLLPLKTAHQFLHPTHRITDPPCLPPPLYPQFSSTQRGLSGQNFPAPSMSSFSQSRGALTPSPAGLGRSSQAQTPGALRWPRREGARSEEEEEEEGARRQTAAPPPRPAQALRQGAGGRGGTRGRPGSRRRPERSGSVKMARGSAGSRRRRRRLGGTGPGLGRLRSSQPRPCPSPAAAPGRAGGPTRTPQPPPPPLGRGRSQREERPRAGGPRGGVPRGREAWEVRDCSALSAREGRKASGTPPLSSGRRHRLTLLATLPLSFQALKPQSSAAAQVPPPSPTPLPSSRQTSQSKISRDYLPDRPDPARGMTACARAPESARILNCGRSCPGFPKN